MSMGRIAAGTSGYAYPEWKPAFYPQELAQKNFLKFYAERLDTVEINNTFYRFPSEKVLQTWRDETPDGFTFAVKATQKITHYGRLRDVGQLTADFVERCGQLGPKLGPILFQLPPNMKRDDQRLGGFLNELPRGPRYAFEFRHESWFDEAVFAALRERGTALCVSEGEKLDAPRELTADFSYVRLRKEDYADSELDDWAAWITTQRLAGRDVYVYLKHDDRGDSPERALRVLAGAK